MQTRWHQADLAGWLLSDENAHEWTVLNLPALAGDDDPLAREPGAALWPDRYDEQWLNNRRARMGNTRSLPVPANAASIRRRVVRCDQNRSGGLRSRMQTGCPLLRSAVTAKKTSDYTVGFETRYHRR